MAKKSVEFSYETYLSMIEEANEVKTVSAVIITAMAQVSQKKLNTLLFGNLLIEAGNRLHAIS